MSNEETETQPATSQLTTAISHIKENPVAYAIGVLVLQQLGWLTKVTSELQGMCF